jgi:hypothetical protein
MAIAEDRRAARQEETGRLTKGGQAFEFYLLRRDAAEQVVVGGRWADWPFPAGSFGGRTGRLGGVTSPVMNAEGRLDAKERRLDNGPVQGAYRKCAGGPPGGRDPVGRPA